MKDPKYNVGILTTDQKIQIYSATISGYLASGLGNTISDEKVVENVASLADKLIRKLEQK